MPIASSSCAVGARYRCPFGLSVHRWGCTNVAKVPRSAGGPAPSGITQSGNVGLSTLFPRRVATRTGRRHLIQLRLLAAIRPRCLKPRSHPRNATCSEKGRGQSLCHERRAAASAARRRRIATLPPPRPSVTLLLSEAEKVDYPARSYIKWSAFSAFPFHFPTMQPICLGAGPLHGGPRLTLWLDTRRDRLRCRLPN